MKISKCVMCGWNFFTSANNPKIICHNLRCKYIKECLVSEKGKIYDLISLAMERDFLGIFIKNIKLVTSLIDYEILLEIEENHYIITDKGKTIYNYIKENYCAGKFSSQKRQES